MEEIFNKMSFLTLEPAQEKIEENVFIKTGLSYDRKISDSDPNKNLKKSLKKIQDLGLDQKCILINNKESNQINDPIDETKKLNDEMINEIPSYIKETIEQILSEKLTNAICLLPQECCLSGNIEIQVIRNILEANVLKRVLHVNLDIEHNLHIQKEFYDNSKNFENSEADFDYIGGQNARGFNINLPMYQAGFGDKEYLSAFYSLLLPISQEFNPQIVLVSTSFNAVKGSTKSGTNLSPDVFAHFISALSCFSDGKLCVLIQEKNESKLFSDCFVSVLRSLLGHPCLRLNNFTEPEKKLVESVLNCVSVLRPFWCCLQQLNENDAEVSLENFLSNVKNTQQKEEQEPILLENDKEQEETLIENCIQKLKLSEIERRTCLCTDESMTKHFNLTNSSHPECPERIKRISAMLKERQLYNLCAELKSRNATDNELKLCHTEQYISQLKTLRTKTHEELVDMSKNVQSVYYNSETFECATLATGCLLQVVDAVCNEDYLNGVAIIRPPGHHANSDTSSGFCFFNSVGVAARYAQKNFNLIKKVLIVDFDVHHGNGTQDIFKDDASVLFISLHRYDDGCFYPVNAESNFNVVGAANAKGFTINVPWNQSSAGDSEYMAAFQRIVMPVAYQFNPDLVLVSAGFDAAAGDPLGGYNISPSGYAQMTKMLSFLADGKIILALEGGYNLNSISESMCSCVSILLGDACPSIPPIHAKLQAYKSIKNVIEEIRPYWSCLQFYGKLPNCEFVKKSKAERSKKNEPRQEITYSLRSRAKPKIEIENSKKKSPDNKNKKEPGLSFEKKTNDKIKKEEENMAAAFGQAETSGSDCFAVIPLNYCPHLEGIKNQKYSPANFDVKKPCLRCKDTKCMENWICLTCEQIYCSRFVKGHMVEHWEEHSHPMALSFSDITVWCYECDSYVHNEILNQAKQLVFKSKFNE